MAGAGGWVLPGPRGGGPPRYSGLAIATALMLRAVFRLALRQTEGLRACRVPRPPCRRRGGASVILNRMLGRFKTRGLVKARIKQRTDSTHVLAALDDLAAVVPDWLRICLLDALEGPIAPASARDLPMLQTLRDVCRVHHTRDEGRLRWRSVAELPAVTERMQSPHDPEAHFSMEQQPGWTGYKVHETRDDDAGHLITHVKTCPSMQLDIISTADIHGQLAAKKRPAAEYSVDFG